MDDTKPMGWEYTVADREVAKTKFKKWRKISIIFGLISPIGYVVLNIIYGILNVNSGGFGWAYLFVLAPVILVGFGVCLVMTIIGFVKMITYSRKSGNMMRTLDFVLAVLMILLVFSPFLISKIWTTALELKKISNLYYWSGYGSISCDFSNRRRADDVDDYTMVIGCMVADYYKTYKKYPTENTVQLFISKKYPEISRDGYRLVINSKDKPNRTDFVIHYGVNCRGEAKNEYGDYTKGFAVYSPLYSPSYIENKDNWRECIDFNPEKD